MGFSTPSYDLIDLFARIDRGDLQLPDFQREYSWDIDRMRALVVTVLRGYPMGSIMALDTRNTPMRFRPRPLADAPDHGVDPGLLLLDGQQRLTTLYHCLRGDGFVDARDFRNKKIRRAFYVDIAKAVSQDVMPDGAVISVDGRGVIRSHFSTLKPIDLDDPASALSHGVIPVAALLSDEGTDMLFDLAEQKPDMKEAIKSFHNQVAKPLIRYQVPMIRLDRETAQGGVGSIFAAANNAGLPMGIFDLLTAVFSTQDPDFKLVEDWERTSAQLRQHPNLDGIKRTEWLQAVALYVTARAGHSSGQCEDILNLTLKDYLAAAQPLREGFIKAADYLAERCMLARSDVPYTFQIVPLAVILTLLDRRLAAEGEAAMTQPQLDRLNRWFWCGVFGELYGSSAVIHRAAIDIAEVPAWVLDAPAPGEKGSKDSNDVAGRSGVQVPSSVQGATFNESRLLSGTDKSAVYKGVYALIQGRGAKDWRSTLPFKGNQEELNPHFAPMFPLAWCAEVGIEPALATSVINRTPMSPKTQVLIDGSLPTRYLPRVQSKSLLDDAEFDAVLTSHLIDPELLYRGQAMEFFADRRDRLVGMVEYAMGSTVVRDVNESDLRGGAEGPNAFI